MSGVLAAILAAKAEEVTALAAAERAAPFVRRHAHRDVGAVLARAPGQALRLVAEHKRRSPSAGALSTVLSPVERSLAYARAGVAMVSVLCDAPFFDGSYDHLTAIRDAFDAADLGVLLLAKEFVIDEVQLRRAAGAGADAVLLVARIVDPPRLRVLVAHARALRLEALVEVVSDDELAAAIDAGASLIGVNARDLDTLAMDGPRAARIVDAIPSGTIAMHLSGLRSADDVATVARSRADAALIGEALMRVDDPSPLLTAMTAAAGAPST